MKNERRLGPPTHTVKGADSVDVTQTRRDQSTMFFLRNLQVYFHFKSSQFSPSSTPQSLHFPLHFSCKLLKFLCHSLENYSNFPRRHRAKTKRERGEGRREERRRGKRGGERKGGEGGGEERETSVAKSAAGGEPSDIVGFRIQK